MEGTQYAAMEADIGSYRGFACWASLALPSDPICHGPQARTPSLRERER